MKKLFVLLCAFSLMACGQSAPETPATDSAENIKTSNDVIVSGDFSGLSDHITTGNVSIVKNDSGYSVVLAEDFSLDGAPSPVLGFGDGEYIAQSKFSKLENKNGYQTYALSADFDPEAYSEIYVWCEKFSIPLGVAALN